MEKIKEVVQYINLMVYMVRADGVVDDDEKTGLLNLLNERLEAPLSEEQTREVLLRLESEGPAAPSDADLLAAGAGIGVHTLSLLVCDAYSLAASDGEIHSKEVQTIRRYLRLTGIPLERFADIDMWARNPSRFPELGEKLLVPVVKS